MSWRIAAVGVARVVLGRRQQQVWPAYRVLFRPWLCAVYLNAVASTLIYNPSSLAQLVQHSDNLMDMYEMPADQPAKIFAYTDKLRGWMIETIVAAVKDLKPAKVSVGEGTARFAVNRRQNTDSCNSTQQELAISALHSICRN